MKTGDIVLIPFPFSDNTQSKLRPALVICVTSDSYQDLVLSAITSVLHFPLSPNELLLKPDNQNGLKVDSILRCDRIMTLKRETSSIKIGTLGMRDFENFKSVFRNLVEEKNEPMQLVT